MPKPPAPAAPMTPAATRPLSPGERRALRARAHALKPVVWIAASGPTEGVLRELDRALSAHELVKIRADIGGREERERLLQSLCTALDAQPVQTIGKVLIAFRPRPKAAEPHARPQPRRQAPGAKPAPGRRIARSRPSGARKRIPRAAHAARPAGRRAPRRG